MFNLQKLTRTLGNGIIIRRANYSNQSSPIISKILEKTDLKVSTAATAASSTAANVGKEFLNVAEAATTTTGKQFAIQKNSMVAAVFDSLKEVDEEKTHGTSSEVSKQSDIVIERILNAKTVNGLLSISEASPQINRNHALKIVSILADWSSINRAKLSDFENDSRFIKLCRILGRAVPKNQSNQFSSSSGISSSSSSPLSSVLSPTSASTSLNGNQKKVTGFRTDDLNTVLSVAGDDEAAKLVASISLSQMIKVMSLLAQKKRRSTPLLRSLAFNISSSSDQLDLKQCADLLYAMASLSFPDAVLIARIGIDVQSGLLKNSDKPAAVGSIVTSFGLLKFRDVDVLESLTDWIIKYQDICRPQDISSLFLTLATLNYQTSKSDVIKSKLVNSLVEKDFAKKNDWLNHVWAMVILNFASNEHLQSILSNEFIENLVIERGADLSITTKLKLLNINAFAEYFQPNYKGIKLSTDSSIFTVPLSYTKSKQILLTGLLDSLKSLFTSTQLIRTNYDTKMGFLIDAECQLDAKRNPLPVATDNENGTRIAIMVVDFHDMCQGAHQQPNGVTALAHRLLEKRGYRILTIPYNEFNTSDKLLKRVQYLEHKFKTLVV